VERPHLFVPPEEKLEVQALGGDSKRWYIDHEPIAAKFARGLPGADFVVPLVLL
jgi:hypothetical protein